MLFARGHLNLYLSSRISLPPAPFVHLSSPPFSPSSPSPSSSSLSCVSFDGCGTSRSPGKNHGEFQRKRERESQEALSRIDSPYSIFEENFPPVRCAPRVERYLWSICKYSSVSGQALKRSFKRDEEGEDFRSFFVSTLWGSSVFPPRGGGSFSDSLLARVLSRLAARLRLASLWSPTGNREIRMQPYTQRPRNSPRACRQNLGPISASPRPSQRTHRSSSSSRSSPACVRARKEKNADALHAEKMTPTIRRELQNHPLLPVPRGVGHKIVGTLEKRHGNFARFSLERSCVRFVGFAVLLRGPIVRNRMQSFLEWILSENDVRIIYLQRRELSGQHCCVLA